MSLTSFLAYCLTFSGDFPKNKWVADDRDEQRSKVDLDDVDDGEEEDYLKNRTNTRNIVF